MRASAARRGAIFPLQRLLSFRVLIALATSASVTAAVAGPMAYQVAKAREEVVLVAAPTTTEVPAITGSGLFSSVYSDHREPTVLDKSRAGVRVWVFYDGPGVMSVSYWIDDPTGSAPATRVASGPFDLDPAGTDWRLQYGLGAHTVLAEVTTIDGTFRRLATFDVYR